MVPIAASFAEKPLESVTVSLHKPYRSNAISLFILQHQSAKYPESMNSKKGMVSAGK